MQITSLAVHPVKSTAIRPLPSAEVLPRGFADDRSWVVVDHEGVVQPQPAPRFSRTGASLSLPPSPAAGTHTREALTAWGVADVDGLLERGVAVQA